jgi:hypothetical protein
MLPNSEHENFRKPRRHGRSATAVVSYPQHGIVQWYGNVLAGLISNQLIDYKRFGEVAEWPNAAVC